MKVCVISDTHARSVSELPEKLKKALAEVDLIIHAGDFTEKAVLDGLESINKVRAVHGNMDSGELRKLLPDKDTFIINGRKIGLAHGSGGPWGIAERIREMFKDEEIIIFGHSHVSYNQHLKGSLMFNPGRARDTYGLLTIDDGVKAEVIRII
jgi:putative phosphoesterase